MKHGRCLILLALTAGALGGDASAGLHSARHYLSGRDRDDAIPWDFYCTGGERAGEWTTIPVPSNWEMHGFGTLSYRSTTPSEEGHYRKRFVAAEAWAGRRVFLVFEGVMTDAEVRLNQRQIGPVHRGGFYRFRHEVTDLLEHGEENLLEVRVWETSADPSVNAAEREGDYWNFGGIYRPVWLEVTPQDFIERVAIDAKADGAITVEVQVNGRPDGWVTARIRRSGDPAVVGAMRAPVAFDGTVHLRGRVDEPQAWSAESPSLYEVDLMLFRGGVPVHEFTERFGFRTFEVRLHEGLFLNGKRVVLQGVNRHSFNARSGRCLGRSDWHEDIALMKEMNMNAVRMSHYPPDKGFLDLCDEMGLYVLDELAGWQRSYSIEAGRPLVAGMVQRDVNHPCVLFWNNGNEGGWQEGLDQEFLRWDPQRRVVLHPWDVHHGINTAHYRTYEETVPMSLGLFPGLRRGGLPLLEEDPFIYMPTEFLHGLFDGGAGAGLEDYWEVMRKSLLAGGGFLWALHDEGVLRPGTGEIDVHGNQGPDGILGPQREKEASFFTIKELWSPVVVHTRQMPAGFSGGIEIENRYAFTNTSQCRFAWELGRLPLPGGGFKTEIVQSGAIAGPDLAPGERGRVFLPLPEDFAAADVLALTILDPAGRELWTTTWSLPGSARFPRVVEENLPNATRPSVSATPQELHVTAGDFHWIVDRSNARLRELRRGGRRCGLANGPRPVGGDGRLEELTWRSDGDAVLVDGRFMGSLRQVNWRFRANGWADCRFIMFPLPSANCRGAAFDLPEHTVQAKRWVGRGPYRVWQNRRRGVSMGAWQLPYNDTVTGWKEWVYPEFKGCFEDVRWLTLVTEDGDLTVVMRSPGLFVQVLTPRFPPDELQLNTRVELPEAGLAFLANIPAIGTKFHPAADLGPSHRTVTLPAEEILVEFSLRLDR